MDEMKKTPVSNETVAMSEEELKMITGGSDGYGDDIPRTPQNPIDENIEKKFS